MNYLASREEAGCEEFVGRVLRRFCGWGIDVERIAAMLDACGDSLEQLDIVEACLNKLCESAPEFAVIGDPADDRDAAVPEEPVVLVCWELLDELYALRTGRTAPAYPGWP